MGTLRTDETEAKYQAAIASGQTQALKDVPSLMAWKYWRLIPNKYPHDLVCEEHDMLVPIRVFSSVTDMNLSEATELLYILTKELQNQYDTVKMNYPRQQTVLNHLHIHLLVNK